MTDKEIIKALECLGGNAMLCQCCPYACRGFPRCKENAAKDALRLIIRQKSQIEDLKEALEERIERIKELEAEAKSETAKKEIAADCIKQQGEEIERLKERLDAKCDICIERDKTVAIREFAERLKEKKTSVCGGHGIYDFVVYECCIDNLVKEMTEDES